MKIKTLGTKAQINQSAKGHEKYTGLLLDNKILIDAGDASYLDYQPAAIFFTHLHPDHAYFMWNNDSFYSPVPAYAPELPESDSNIQVINQPVQFEDYKITPIPVIHSLKMKSYGYLVENGANCRVFVSGDIAWIEKQYQEKLTYLDLVITDGSTIKKTGMIRRDKKSGQIYGHNGIPELISIFEKYTSHIIFIHLGEWFMKDPEHGAQKIKDLAGEGQNFEVGSDGEEFNICLHF